MNEQQYVYRMIGYKNGMSKHWLEPLTESEMQETLTEWKIKPEVDRIDVDKLLASDPTKCHSSDVWTHSNGRWHKYHFHVGRTNDGLDKHLLRVGLLGTDDRHARLAMAELANYAPILSFSSKKGYRLAIIYASTNLASSTSKPG